LKPQAIQSNGSPPPRNRYRRSIRSTDAPQATKGNDEDETAAFNAFKDVSPRARLYAVFPDIAGRLMGSA
jgi:hypothetical protein